MKAKTCLTLSILTLALSVAEVAQAANFTWDGTGNWTDSTWSPGSVTGPTASTDTATINTGTVTITGLAIDSAIIIATGATLETNAQEGTSNVVLSGNLTGSGILNKTGGWSLVLSGDNSGFSGAINATASNTFFQADSAGSAAADWVLSSGSNVVNNQTGTGHVIQLGSLAGTGGTLGGGNAVGAAATFEVGGNGKSTSFGGQIVDTPAGFGGGTASLKVVGGTLILTGANNYSGGTAVNFGTLQIGDSGPSGTLGSGNVTIDANLTLKRSDNYNTGSSQVFSGAGTITKDGAADLVFNGPVDHTNVQGVSNVVVNDGLIRTDNYGKWNSALDLTVNGSGKFEMWNNESVSLANLSGNGTVQNTKYWFRSQTLTIAAGSFSGSITDLGITSGGPGTGDTRINLVKSGSGTLTLSGTNSYNGNTTVNDGTFSIPSGGSLRFRPTTSGQTNALSGTASATLSYLGTVNLDLSAADTIDGNTWTLVNVGSFSGPAPTLTPAAVTSTLGSFNETTPGTWELDVTGAKWIFDESAGTLLYEVTATDYEIWGMPYGLTAGSEGLDLDNDGVTNFEEYAFGLTPDSGDSVNPIAAPLDKTAGTFSYTRRTGSGLTYSVWFSTDLNGWLEDTSATDGIPVPSGDNETVEVTLSNLPGDPLPAKLFIQVRAN